MPTKQEVDARVQAAIENLQMGRTVEDDAGIEFKREWPDPSKKARQLAGAANALRGEHLIYVIGVADDDGSIVTPTRTEPSEWYARICRPFDQLAPELLWSQTIFVGAQTESVVALVFDTSEFPYVINDENRREVPIRVGAGTESAKRSQLIRMLAPSARVPAMSVTECSLRATWEEVQPKDPTDAGASKPSHLNLVLDVDAQILIEHFGSHPTTLPVRDMHGRLQWNDQTERLRVRVPELGGDTLLFRPPGEPAPPDPVPPQFGVYARSGHVIATAPGEVTVLAKSEYVEVPPQDERANQVLQALADADQVRFELALRVVGVDNLIRLNASLKRRTAAAPGKTSDSPRRTMVRGELGEWCLAPAEIDPWS